MVEFIAENQRWPKNIQVQVGCDSFINVAEGMLKHLEEQEAMLAPTFASSTPSASRASRWTFCARRSRSQVYFDFNTVNRFEMVNKKGKTGCFLFYGTRNIAGLRVMKDAMWMVDPGF